MRSASGSHLPKCPRSRNVGLFVVMGLLILACDGEGTPKPKEEGCTGDACSSLELRKRSSDGCMVFFNTSNRTIAYEVNTTFVSSGDVYAKSEFVPTFGLGGEECLKNFPHSYTAKFK